MSTTRVSVLAGCGSFGTKNGAQVRTLPDAQAIVDVFIAHGHNQFDTAESYGHGTSEEFLSQLDLKGGIVDTKVFPMLAGAHAPEKLRATFQQSLKRLGPNIKVNIFYLHAPDSATPFEDTHHEINELFKQGLFKEFGLSNFTSSQVVEFHNIAEKKGWIAPTVYQGRYNIIQREVEADLIPVLRKYNMRFYAYSPLALGILSGNMRDEKDLTRNDGSRWDPSAVTPFLSQYVRGHQPLLPIIRDIISASETLKFSLPNVALRWLQHHSLLTPSDGLLLGGSSVKQIEENLGHCEEGPLPVEILKVLDEAWAKAAKQSSGAA